jgi:hypothetical protein
MGIILLLLFHARILTFWPQKSEFQPLFPPGSGQDLQIEGFPKRLDAVCSMLQTITIEEDKVKFPDSPSGPHFPANWNALLVLRNSPKLTDFSD